MIHRQSLTERLWSVPAERRRYMLGALTHHLEAAGEGDKLHSLLREEECAQEPADEPSGFKGLLALFGRAAPAARVRCVNWWFSLQEAEGTEAAFIDDVSRAWRLAETARAPGLAARYALILSSINDLGSAVTPQLVERLLGAGLWTPLRALTYARRVPGSSRRSAALAAVAGHADGSERHDILREALDATLLIRDDAARAESLAGLTPHLCAELLGQALTAARAFEVEHDRARALNALAAQMPEPLKSEVMREAEAAAVEGEGHGFRAARAPASEVGRGDEGPRLDPDAARRALRAAARLKSKGERATSLKRLAPRLPEGVGREAFAVVGKIKQAVHQVEPLAALVRRFPSAAAEEWLGRVLVAATREYRSQSERSAALARLIEDLPEGLLAVALSESRRIDDERSRVKALTALGLTLPASPRAEVSRRASDTARGVHSRRERAEALADVMPLVAETTGVAEALDLALSIEYSDQCARAVSVLLGRLAPGERDRVVRSLLRRWKRLERHEELLPAAFDHLAPHLSGAHWQSAVDFARGKTWPSCRAGILSSLMRHAPDTERLRAVLPLALEVTTEPVRSNVRVEAAQHLARLGHHEEALSLAAGLSDELRRLDALEGVIPHLPAHMLPRASSEAEAFTYEGRRSSLLAVLAPRLAAAGEWDAAVRSMVSIPVYHRRALAAARMAAHAPPSERARVVDHARQIVVNAQRRFEGSEDWWQGETLTLLAPHVGEAELGEVLMLALNVVDAGERAGALSAIATEATRMRPAAADEVWWRALRRSSEMSRADLLANLLALSPLLERLDGAEAVAELAEAVHDVGRWWPS